MRKKNLLLISCMSFITLCSGTVMGQQGVLFPKSDAHDHVCDESCEYAHIKSEFFYAEPEERLVVTPRRGHTPGAIDTIGIAGSYASDVRNEFGAGESSRINSTHQIQINPITALPYGGSTHTISALASPVSEIQLGSNYSKNVVIKTYTGGGFAMGWMSVLSAHVVPSAPIMPANINSWEDVKAIIPSGNYKDAPASTANNYFCFSFNKYNRTNFDLTPPNTNPWNSYDLPGAMPTYVNPCTGTSHSNENTVASSGSVLAPCGRSLFELHYTPIGGGQANLWVYHHTTSNVPCVTVRPSDRPQYYYTTSIDNQYRITWPNNTFVDGVPSGTTIAFPTDDDVPLVQVNGTIMKSASDMTAQVTMASTVGTEDYSITPGGDHNLITPVSNPSGTHWSNSSAVNMANYKRPTTVLVEAGNHTFDKFTIADINWWYTADTIEAAIGPVKGNSTGCGSGVMTFITVDPRWKRTATPPMGATFIDGAIALAPDANVCIVNSVRDSTTTASTTKPLGQLKADGETDAILVFPNDGRYTMRVGVDIDSINMTHDIVTPYIQANNPTNQFYKQSTFPEAATDIYSYPDASSFGSGFQFAAHALGGFSNSGRVNLVAPPVSTEASVIGVKHNYNYKANNAEWHTNTPTTVFNHPGVIEIGDTTRGTGHMHIYSGGMLKNYESCACNCSYTMHLGSPIDLGGDGAAPNFYINGTDPLYIMNYGVNYPCDKCKAGITLYQAAVDNIESAIAGAAASGAMHIQALGNVQFDTIFQPAVTAQNNELRILSSEGSVIYDTSFIYTNIGDSSLVVWAKGAGTLRSCMDNNCGGYIWFNGETSISQSGKGLTLLRSEYDDVLIDSSFKYTNTTQVDANGEFIMQAGQDIYGKAMIPGDANNLIEFTPYGNKNILLEAQHTIHLEQKLSYQKTNPTAASTGDFILKAGYHNFNTSAGASVWTNGLCRGPLAGNVTQAYPDRDECMSDKGGDIWFEGPLDLQFTAFATDDQSSMLFRAYNSVFVDSALTYNNTTKVGGNTRIMAHTGNVEAIKYVGTKATPVDNVVSYTITDSDNTTEIRLQAGNDNTNAGVMDIVDICAPSVCNLNKWNGNILFNKPLTVSHKGKGYTILSAERDIETQVDAPFVFAYENAAVDDFDMTAGRHIETHRGMYFDYNTAGTTATANITLQAGRLDLGVDCSDYLCKTFEAGTNLATGYNASANNTAYEPYGKSGYNDFADGGSGHGSILLFDTLQFDYKGEGTILLTALNGNVESDPYLHRFETEANRHNSNTAGYDALNNIHNAPIVFNHAGTGITRMEAIDIKLHDKMAYYGTSATDAKNGQFYMAAFDSILTRNVEYRNYKDTGSVFITTDKIKYDASGQDLNCGAYSCLTGGPGIHQGHIVLGYGADATNDNVNDSIIFDFNSTALNSNTVGANLYIKAGYEGFNNNKETGKANRTLFANHPDDRGKGYGGNITFDFMQVYMAKGNGTAGGYTEISTPNGNIWGKDSLQYHGINGNLLIDAGLGSLEDTLHAVRWPGFPTCAGNGSEAMLNTQVPYACGNEGEWRTGNIMLKGGSVDFADVTGSGNPGTGNVIFRTREGFIDVYDQFNATNMSGHLLKYAGSDNPTIAVRNQWADVSERDFQYIQVEYSGSVFFGADDNIMLNYGYSNANEPAYNILTPGIYDVTAAGIVGTPDDNPYYNTSYEGYIDGLTYAKFNVNENGYMWYRNGTDDNGTGWPRRYHRLYRGCDDGFQTPVCSPLTGQCETIDNGARPLTFDFNTLADGTSVRSGGLAVVATNYVDLFTAFTYRGGNGSGLHSVPGMTTLKGESVSGYGLYMKSTFDGTAPEKRRLTCEDCGSSDEWTYIGFHDDARIHTNNQKSLLEAPVIEFFGHAELDATTLKGSKTRLTLKADSLIFHDSAIFDGDALELLPYTTDATVRANDMRYGVVNDNDGKYYREFGKAISMTDRQMPVVELGYQRCFEPNNVGNAVPNKNSLAGKEKTPMVGGDIIVTFKNGFGLPILNTVVANHARISFISDSIDGEGGIYDDAFIRTDLLRIRNRVEFHTDPAQSTYRRGVLKMTSKEQMPSVQEAGIYPHHIHMEPGSELSIPGEDSLIVIATTTVGGYGKIHENIVVKANGILAPGFASLMEYDCQSGRNPGRLDVHNLKMEDHAILRISMSQALVYNPDTKTKEWTMQSDTLVAHDSIYFSENVQLQVLSDFDQFYPGCYLFLVYDDEVLSPEYVKNLQLQTQRYGDYHLALDFSEDGRVYLCVTEHPTPIVTRYIHIHTIDGVTTNPAGNMDHFVAGHKDFTFTATYADGNPLEVLAKGYYSMSSVKLAATHVSGNVYEYSISQVVQPWDITFGGLDTSVGNDGIHSQRVWSHRNTLYVNVEKEDIVSIYNLTGVLYKKVELPAGLNTLTLERGVYVITLKDGSVHKIVIK